MKNKRVEKGKNKSELSSHFASAPKRSKNNSARSNRRRRKSEIN